MNKSLKEEEDSNQGFVILETNYRVYAYTGMLVEIAVY